MATLLVRLAGPMQSWGTQSRFTVRDTGMEPSRSGVTGLLCAALGRPRDADLADLAGLRMGVRVDREGAVRRDYQTAGGSPHGEGYGVATVGGKGLGVVLSNRYYLADADFLVGLESDDEGFLHTLNNALAAPRWPLFLGRKAFVPGLPVRLPDAPPWGPGVRPEPLDELLRTYPWHEGLRRQGERKPQQLRLVLETADPRLGEARRDVPLSFVSADRRFGLRYVATATVPLGGDGGVPILKE